MSDTKSIGPGDLDEPCLFEEFHGVDLQRLPPFTMLIVRTANSVYRVVITHTRDVYVQGGAYFPEPTLASFDGVVTGSGSRRVDWIGVGFAAEIRWADQRVITSPIRSVAIEHVSLSMVH